MNLGGTALLTPFFRGVFYIKGEIMQEKFNQIKENATANSSNQETEPTKKSRIISTDEDINFLDPDEFMKFASRQANDLTDEKDRRAYLEMIAKLMNYKDKDQDEQQQIRAYLPQTCENCELYARCSRCSLSSCAVPDK